MFGRNFARPNHLPVLLAVTIALSGTLLHAQDDASATADVIDSIRRDPQNILGVRRGDCKKCHPSEVAAWMKTAHYRTAELKLFKFSGDTKKYADAMKIDRSSLMKDSICASCHGTQAKTGNGLELISGVSCESCHGAAGGKNGWLNRHQAYHESLIVTRSEETAEHLAKRIEYCESAGMIRSDNVYDQASACFKCHVVDNEALIVAGHSAYSRSFEYASWSEGETRHNFLLNRTKNEKAPSIWLEKGNRVVENRRRVKFVLGMMAQLEAGLRARAKAKNPAAIPKIGGAVAAIYGKLIPISAVVQTEEIPAMVGIVTPMLGTMFAPLPEDAKTYSTAADQVAGLARKFAKNHDGSKLAALDAQIQATPPHFSQQFRDRYLRK